MPKRNIAAFDFDGTLTSKDTFLEFIAFVFGRKKLYLTFAQFSPILLLMKLGLFPNWKAKQLVYSWFFKGMDYNHFCNLGISFAEKIKEMRNEEGMSYLHIQKQAGADIYIITASVEEWVNPFCQLLNIKGVIATKVEVDNNGLLTGRFLTHNCYGQEKVNRLLLIEPERNQYELFACGDSKGDKELLSFADKAVKIRKKNEFLRFCIVGLVCTLVDAIIFYAFNSFFSYQISLVSGYLISLILNYYLTIHWTFKSKSNLKNAIGIILAHLFNLFVVRMGLMSVFINICGVSNIIAYIPTLLISVITNFLIIRFVVKHYTSRILK